MASKRGYELHEKDNGYAQDMKRLLEFIITTKYVASIGTIANSLFINNDKWFRKHNVDSIWSVEQYTKNNSRKGGYIG